MGLGCSRPTPLEVNKFGDLKSVETKQVYRSYKFSTLCISEHTYTRDKTREIREWSYSTKYFSFVT